METVFFVVLGLVLLFGFVVLRGAPYVPTHRKQLNRAFDELYQVSDKDFVVDLGSGDGIVLLQAARRGAQGVGYELNPLLVLIANFRLRGHKARTQVADYLALKQLPPETTLVYAFTTGHSIESIHRKMLAWSTHQDLYFISYGFRIEGKKPLRSIGPMVLYHYQKQA